MTPEELQEFRKTRPYSWTVSDDPKNCNGKCIDIYHYGEHVMSLSGYEVIECMGKRFVEEHTKRCNGLTHLAYWETAK